MNLDTSYPKKDVISEEESSIVTQTQKEAVGYRVPTEIIDLPSRGLLYPKDSPLHKGSIEIKYMTAKEEDILTTESYIKKGIVIDKFLESLIVTEGIKLDDLLVGDIDAITVAARIFGYGSEYEVSIDTPSGKKQRETIDLSEIDLKYLDEQYVDKLGVNEFNFELPSSKNKITFRMLRQLDQKKLQEEIEKNKKIFNGLSKISSTQLKYYIVSVDGNYDFKYIKDFVDTGMLASDARSLRKYIEEIQPGINLSVEVTDRQTGETFRTNAPIGVQFFWPDVKV
jgi:hypothetical protein